MKPLLINQNPHQPDRGRANRVDVAADRRGKIEDPRLGSRAEGGACPLMNPGPGSDGRSTGLSALLAPASRSTCFIFLENAIYQIKENCVIKSKKRFGLAA